MENLVTSDIFKFMALRPPKNFDHAKDLVTIIRDSRIRDTYLPDEVHTVIEDEAKFSKSQVAQYVFDRIKAYLPNVLSNKDSISLSDLIAEDVKMQFGINERTGRPWIDDFVSAIKQHTTDFNKVRLLADLNDVIKKHFPRYSGIRDYVEVVADQNVSSFCYDYEYLFERLYALYVCKRQYPINLEYVIDGLKALHVVRFLKIDLDQRQQTPSSGPMGCLFTLQALLEGKDSRARLKDPVESPGDGGEQTHEARTDCAEKQLAEGGALIQTVTIETKEDLAYLFGASPYIHQLFACLLGYYKPFNDIRPLGIGDLLVVKQFLYKYEAGEIAHVENVLKGESKERSHRRLDRTEDIFSTQTEKSEETDKELQTTDRYELKTETESTIQNDLNAEIAGSVSGKYGTVEYSASAGISYSLSTSDSRRSTNNFAKDIIDRSLTRVQKRTREERTSKKIYETEEINKHGLNNTNGSGHISGIYRWLDKRYKAQVYNYGKRLMFEFVIPEPAAFIKAAFEQNKKKQNKPDMPQKPTFPDLDISQIDNATVNTYAARYNISDLEPEPAAGRQISASFTVSGSNEGSSAHEKTVNIPEGYIANTVDVAGGYEGWDKTFPNPDHGIFVTIGGQVIIDTENGVIHETFENQRFTLSPGMSGNLGVSLYTYKVHALAITLSINCALDPEAKRKWQIKTYTKIMEAYEKRLAEYKSALSEYQDKLEGYNASQGIVIQGRNPGINQDIIKTELKKHCITMIAKQFDTVKEDDIHFDAMKLRQEQVQEETTVVTETKKVTQTTPTPGTTVTVTETTIAESMTTSPVSIDIPAIDIPEAREEGNIIQFLEQAFEWPQVSYLLYPYFWGRMPDKWFEAQTFFDEPDPLYAKFLQAGSARVLVAVRPAYEVAVMHYLCTRKPWNGGSAPGIHNPLYIPIYEELRNQQDDLNGAEPYGDPWDVVVPTSLVYLQGSSELPSYDFTLPTQKK